MEKDQKHRLEDFFRGNLLYDAALKDFTSFRVGGPADVIAFPKDMEDLVCLLLFIQREKLASFILGEGTNLVVRDSGFKGMVIKLSPGFTAVTLEKGEGGKVSVRAQAGERLSRVLGFTLRQSITGLEFVSGIPGSVGGALRMNAGAYGNEMKNVTASISVLTSNGLVRYLGRGDLRFSYRKLHLPADTIITEAVLALSPGSRREIAARIKENQHKRRKSQPWGLPSAGSVFKNPPSLYAAQLIEELGLKGYQIGGAAVSRRHANFIVNCGSATASDILGLMAFVQKRVWQEKGIMLEPEIQTVGEDWGVGIRD